MLQGCPLHSVARAGSVVAALMTLSGHSPKVEGGLGVQKASDWTLFRPSLSNMGIRS